MPLPKRAVAAARKAVHKQAAGPLWTGPSGEGPNGGVTQGLLARWLTCRERARLRLVDGWREADRFEERLEFGQLWHAAEEALATKGSGATHASGGTTSFWNAALIRYHQDLLRRYPFNREKITHWAEMILALFPEYVKYWAGHPDEAERTTLLQEHPFDVPYTLPSGRVVRLRGRWDLVGLLRGGVELTDHKTKGKIDYEKLERQLRWDLQVMFYLVALYQQGRWADEPANGTYYESEGHYASDVPPYPIRWVRYNVVRRPAHKSVESAIRKFADDLADNRAGEWFARWQFEVKPADVGRFRRESLDPILENLCDWWDEVSPPAHQNRPINYGTPLNFRMPYHYSPLAEGGFGDLDALLDSGNAAGLRRATVLFPELQEG